MIQIKITTQIHDYNPLSADPNEMLGTRTCSSLVMTSTTKFAFIYILYVLKWIDTKTI